MRKFSLWSAPGCNALRGHLRGTCLGSEALGQRLFLMWKGECKVRVFLNTGSRSFLRWAAPPWSWERKLGTPGKLPQISGLGFWQGEGVARRQLGHSQPWEPRQTASSPPHPQCQLQKVGRAPARARLDELPAPHWAGRSKGPGPTLHLGLSTHTDTLSPALLPFS